ncbi:MAG: ATP-dependent helicase [Actinomycetota bacterium]
MPFTPDAEQRKVLDHAAGPILVTGSAGTGKTSVLRERFARLIEGGSVPERVALVVGSRSERQRNRAALLSRLQRSLPDLPVLTVHGLAFRVVSERYRALEYERPPDVLSAAEQFAKVRELLDGEDPAQWPAYGSMLRLRGFADHLRQFVIRAQEALLRPDDIRARAEASGLTGWLELATFYERYLQVLDGEGVVDFAALVEQAAAAAEKGGPLFDHLLVDDYHDTTLAVEALIAGLDPKGLVVAGDPEAHVFSFQGTTDKPLSRFAERYPAAERVELRTRHRGTDVRLDAWRASHISEEHAAIARELRRTHVDENVSWGDLAVVVRRQGDHMGGLLRALDDAGIPRTVPEGGMSITAEPATLPFLLALRWLARPAERDALIESVLTSDLVRLSPADARGLIRIAQATLGSPAAALSITEGLDPSHAEALGELREILEEAEKVARRSVLETFAILWRRLRFSQQLVRDAADAAEGPRDLDAVMALSDVIAGNGSGRGDRSVEAFLSGLEAGEEGPGHRASDPGDPEAAHVLTAHGAVGREFDTVIVTGTVEGDFPSLTRPEPMFDLKTLERRIAQSERNRLRLEDERRLFRMVIGRARRRVVLTASDAHGEEAAISAGSRFADELGLEWAPAPTGPFEEPVSVAEAAAVWRRTLANPSAPPAERLASLDGLLALKVQPHRWWFQRDWTDTGHPLHDAIRVSYSRLDTLENCELQFVLAEELGLGRPAGYQAWVGKIVHRIIEDCENGKIDRTLDALRAAVEERWRRQEFPSLAVSAAFKDLVMTKVLPNWVQHYGQTPAVATEIGFEFDYDGATINGYIDRIGPILAGGNRITDFKTGKPDNAPKAEESLQLGTYYLAVLESEELSRYRPVRGVELAFLKGHWRTGELERRGWQVSSKTEEDYQARMRERLSDLIDRIRTLIDSETYHPNPAANCFFCDFKTLCPLYPEGVPLFPVTEEQQ